MGFVVAQGRKKPPKRYRSEETIGGLYYGGGGPIGLGGEKRLEPRG